MQELTEPKRVASDATVREGGGARGELIVARVPQGYEANINVRLVPGRDLDIAVRPKGCRPRQGAPRRDAAPLDLPPDLVDKLKAADKAVIAWLAEDEANARMFLARPAEALAKAGVDLDRGDLKAIERTHREVREAAVIGPGVKVANLAAAAFPRGRIGKIKPGARPRADRGDDAGCAKE